MVTQQRKQTVPAEESNLPPDTQAAFAEMAIAHDYARDVRCDPWQFAVEISRLTDLGLTASDLRWLVEKRYATHACEITQAGDFERKFDSVRHTAFTKETCFLLTESGLLFARQATSGPTLLAVAHPAAIGNGSAAGSCGGGSREGTLPMRRAAVQLPQAAKCVPRWDGVDGTLYMGEQIVKRFKRRSPNQEAILMAFEEEGWPRRIDDPLPPSLEIVPQRRLHDTIKWLNRDQENSLVRFYGDGSGEGVRWEGISAGTLPVADEVPQKLRAAA